MKKDEKILGGEVVFYKAPKGKVQLDVRLEHDHINNVFSGKELEKKSNVQNMHIASSDKPVAFYSLDTIISVGYRVKSKEGTRFRIWATQTLKDHLLKGYTLNERRLREKGIEFEQAVALLGKTLTNHALVKDEGRAVLDIVRSYAKTWGVAVRL